MRLLIILFVLIQLTACKNNQDYISKQCNFIYHYNSALKVNFNTGELKLDNGDDIYTDTMKFSADEKTRVAKAFDANEIYNIKGFNSYTTNIVIMPPDAINIDVYSGKRQRSQLMIYNNVTANKYFKFSEQERVIAFRDIIRDIIESKQQFKKALEIDRRQPRLLL